MRHSLPLQNAERFDSDLLDADWQLAAGQIDLAAAALSRLTPPSGRGDYRRRARYADASARVAAAQGNWSVARHASQQSLDALHAELGNEHPLCARAMAQQALYAHALHADSDARELLRPVLPVLRRALVAQAPERIAVERLAHELGISG